VAAASRGDPFNAFRSKSGIFRPSGSDPLCRHLSSRGASRGSFLTAFIAAATFGPYVFGGFRTEQIAVYGVALLMSTTASWLRIRLPDHARLVAVLLVAPLALGLVGAVSPPFNASRYLLGSALAGLDNLVLPIAVAFVVSSMVAAGADRDALTRIVCTITVWVMTINAGLEVWATGGNGPDLDAFHGLGTLESVSDRAEQLGRYSGIFNQPAEAGLLYSVALVAAVYLYRQRAVLLALTATAVTIGGVLTISKTFLFVGFPIGVWHVLRSAGGRVRRYAAVVALALAAWAGAKSGLTPVWKGGAFLLELMPGRNQGAVDQYTAGRLGETSTLSFVIDAVMQSSPITGFGAGGLLVAYDNAWVEALVVNGLIGAALYTAMLCALAYCWVHTRPLMDAAQTRLAGGLIIIVVGASVGVPALSVNRCATILWLLLSLLLLTAEAPDRGGLRPVRFDVVRTHQRARHFR
jgi:hypothetical protein